MYRPGLARHLQNVACAQNSHRSAHLTRLLTQASANTTNSSVNADEIAHFSRLSSKWWDERGEFGLLHKMNPVRVQFIRDKLLEVARDELEPEETEILERNCRALEHMDVLDIGSGGGLLSESLARLGAQTVGVDASASNIAIASLHASADPRLSSSSSSLEYRHTSAEALMKQEQRFDIVCAMEVLEHVDNPAEFLTSCAELVKPGGHLFLSTIARTPLSYALTILGAEHVFRLVTPGTHTYSKFINPSELVSFFHDQNSTKLLDPWISRTYDGGIPIRTESEVRGMIYLPWKGEWMLAPRGVWGATECNYMFWVRKPTLR